MGDGLLLVFQNYFLSRRELLYYYYHHLIIAHYIYHLHQFDSERDVGYRYRQVVFLCWIITPDAMEGNSVIRAIANVQKQSKIHDGKFKEKL